MPAKTVLGRWLLKKKTKKEAHKAATNFAGPILARLQVVAGRLNDIPAGSLKDNISRQHAEFTQRISAPPTDPQQALTFWTLVDEKSLELENLSVEAAVAGQKVIAWADKELADLNKAVAAEGTSVRALVKNECDRISGLTSALHAKFNQRDFGSVDGEAGAVFHASRAAVAKLASAKKYVADRDPLLIKVGALKSHPQLGVDAAAQLVRLDKVVKVMVSKEKTLDFSGAHADCSELLGVYKIVKRSGKSKAAYDTKKREVEVELAKLGAHLMSVFVKNELAVLAKRVKDSLALATKESGGYQKGLNELVMVGTSLDAVKQLLAKAWTLSKRTPQLTKTLEDEGMDPARAALVSTSAIKILCEEDGISNDEALKMAKDAQGFIEDNKMFEPDALMCSRVKFTLEAEGLDAESAKAIGRNMRGGGSSSGADVKAVARKMKTLSKGVMDALNDAGVTTVACRGPVTEVLCDLMGELPRGWPADMTWDSVPGVCSGGTQVVVGTMDDGSGVRKVPGPGEGPLPHGTPDLVGHETGHAFDTADGTYKSQHPNFLAARTACISNPTAIPPIVGSMMPGTDDYFLTRLEGGTNDAGASSETFAESFAMHFGGGARWPKLDAFWKSKPFGI